MTIQYKWLPSEPTVEMVNAGINVWLNQENPNKPINFVEIFKAMWEKATEVEQEPVAYRNFNQGEGGYEYPWLYVDADDLVGHTDAYIRNAEPLYTHPQPKRDAIIWLDKNVVDKRKSLTVEQYEELSRGDA